MVMLINLSLLHLAMTSNSSVVSPSLLRLAEAMYPAALKTLSRDISRDISLLFSPLATYPAIISRDIIAGNIPACIAGLILYPILYRWLETIAHLQANLIKPLISHNHQDVYSFTFTNMQDLDIEHNGPLRN